MYAKTITPAFETIGNRKRLTGYLAELHDGELLLYSCEYPTNSQAEKVLDGLVFELLTLLADQGLVDDVPAALEAEHVSSTHLPGWQATIITVPTPVCANPDCNGPHHTYQCPAIRARLFAEPVVMVVDVEYAPLGWAA